MQIIDAFFWSEAFKLVEAGYACSAIMVYLPACSCSLPGVSPAGSEPPCSGSHWRMQAPHTAAPAAILHLCLLVVICSISSATRIVKVDQQEMLLPQVCSGSLLLHEYVPSRTKGGCRYIRLLRRV